MENFLTEGPGSGYGLEKNIAPDPVNIRPDPKPWSREENGTFCSSSNVQSFLPPYFQLPLETYISFLLLSLDPMSRLPPALPLSMIYRNSIVLLPLSLYQIPNGLPLSLLMLSSFQNQTISFCCRSVARKAWASRSRSASATIHRRSPPQSSPAAAWPGQSRWGHQDPPPQPLQDPPSQVIFFILSIIHKNIYNLT